MFATVLVTALAVGLVFGSPTDRLTKAIKAQEFSCYSCVDLPEGETCDQITVCQPGHEHCMTQHHYEEDGTKLITTGCSHMHICMNKEENNAEECYWDESGDFEGSCTYCCEDSLCNTVVSPHDDCDDLDDKKNCMKNVPADKPDSKGAKPDSKPTKPNSKGTKPNSKGTKPNSNGKPTKPNSKGTKPNSNGKPTKPNSNGKPSKPNSNGKPSKPNSNGRPTKPVRSTPSKTPSVTQAPQTRPQATNAPQTQPPATNAPQTKPPATIAPQTKPPATNAPQTKPPATNAPQTKPPATNAPQTQPPATRPPATNAPQTKPPAPQGSGGSSWNGDSSSIEHGGNRPSCHSHNGRPCCKSHGGPAINVDVHVHIDGGSYGFGNCPACNNNGGKSTKQPIVNMQKTGQPTTDKPTTDKPTTEQPTTVQPTTAKPTTVQPTTDKPTTMQPTTAKPTTIQPTTAKPTTVQPTTEKPTTVQPTTAKPTTIQPTTAKPTTVQPTTAKPTTVQPTTAKPTTVQPTTAKPTTAQPKSVQPTTVPTSPKPSFTCYTCKDQECQDQKPTSCSSGSEYCMTTIQQDKDGKRIFTKGCVTESVCKNKWWLATAPNPDCLLNMDDGPTGLPNQAMTCSFCCVTKECNEHAVPEFSTFYTSTRRR